MKRLAMKKTSLAVLLLTCLSATLRSQEQAPQLLIRAVHCLAVKNNFPSSKATALSFGYLVDEKSYPGEKVLYIVNYAPPAHSNGLAFTIFLTQRDDYQVFDVQNSASFVLSRNGIDGVSFTNPPLGGTWTQEHLASAIKRIEKEPRFSISLKELSVAEPSIRCESYTDPQPKRGER
jgi:hypothetical protein